MTFNCSQTQDKQS